MGTMLYHRLKAILGASQIMRLLVPLDKVQIDPRWGQLSFVIDRGSSHSNHQRKTMKRLLVAVLKM